MNLTHLKKLKIKRAQIVFIFRGRKLIFLFRNKDQNLLVLMKNILKMFQIISYIIIKLITILVRDKSKVKSLYLRLLLWINWKLNNHFQLTLKYLQISSVLMNLKL